VLSQKTKIDKTPNIMNPYIYYNKLDSNKEIQGKFHAIDLEEATKIAANKKQMTVEDFLTVFKVEEWKKEFTLNKRGELLTSK